MKYDDLHLNPIGRLVLGRDMLKPLEFDVRTSQ